MLRFSCLFLLYMLYISVACLQKAKLLYNYKIQLCKYSRAFLLCLLFILEVKLSWVLSVGHLDIMGFRSTERERDGSFKSFMKGYFFCSCSMVEDRIWNSSADYFHLSAPVGRAESSRWKRISLLECLSLYCFPRLPLSNAQNFDHYTTSLSLFLCIALAPDTPQV